MKRKRIGDVGRRVEGMSRRAAKRKVGEVGAGCNNSGYKEGMGMKKKRGR